VTALYGRVKGTPSGAELWARTAAMIGAARLAKRHGDAAMQAEAAGYAAAGLAAATAFQAQATAHDGTERFQIFALPLIGYQKGTNDAKVSRGLAREVLRAIGASATGRAQAAAYLTAYVHANDYTYGPSQVLRTTLVDPFGTEHGGWSASEGGSLAPENQWGLFLVHAYALGAGQDALRLWLDAPYGRADLMAIDRLVAAIEATPGGPAPAPVDLTPGTPSLADAGSGAPDAGSGAPDAGSGAPDARGPDAGSAGPDAGVADAGMTSASVDGGCGCGVGPGPGGGVLAVAAAVSLVVLRRRRR
jgi:MYXO-CTERM domain-containing protein